MEKHQSITSSVFKKSLVTYVSMNVVAFLGMIVDAAVITRFLGAEAPLTAYGLVTPALMIFVALAQTIGNGNQPLCSEAMGRGDIKSANRIFSAAFLFLTGLSIAIVLICVFFSGPICQLMGAKPGTETYSMASAYLIGYGLGAPAFMGVLFWPGILQLDGDRSRVVAATITMIVMDIFLDLANVFVFHGGMFGMGLASSISYYAAAIVMMLHFLNKNYMFRFELKDAAWNMIVPVILRGASQTIYALSRTFMTILLNRILLRFGSELYVGAYSVVSTIGNLIMSLGYGIGSCSLMMAGVSYGEKDRTGLKDLIRELLKESIIYNLILILLVEFTSPFLIDIFLAGKADVRELALYGLRLYVPFLICFSINNGLRQYLSGLGLLKMANVQSIMENVFIVLSAWMLTVTFGVNYIWLAFFTGHLFTLVLYVISVFIRNKNAEISWDAFILVGKDFGIDASNSLEMSISKPEEVFHFSEKAYTFMREHNASSRNSMLISLFIEEMAGNVIRYGFSDGKKHLLSIKVGIENDGYLLRIKDDCRRFSPAEYMEIHHPEDPASNIGIRMVYNLAKSIQYQNSLKLNNLLITL